MARKRANRERRRQGSSPPSRLLDSTPSFEIEPLSPQRNLGLSAIIAGGASVSAVLGVLFYFLFLADTDIGQVDNLVSGKPTPSTASTHTVPFSTNVPNAAPTDVVIKTERDAQATGSAGPKGSGSNIVSEYPKDPLADVSFDIAKDELDKHIQVLRQKLQLRPKDGTSRVALAGLLEAEGDFDQAEEHYRRGVKEAPMYARGRHNYGIFLVQRRQRLDEGTHQLNMAADLAPDSAQIRVGLGFVLGESGNMAAAIEQFNLALKLNPSHVGAHFYLANALEEVGQSDEAAEHYRTALQLQPSHHGAHYGLGIILAKQGDSEGALKQFRMTKISPNIKLRDLAEKAISHLEKTK